jgi:hypothetical protein
VECEGAEKRWWFGSGWALIRVHFLSIIEDFHFIFLVCLELMNLVLCTGQVFVFLQALRSCFV